MIPFVDLQLPTSYYNSQASTYRANYITMDTIAYVTGRQFYSVDDSCSNPNNFTNGDRADHTDVMRIIRGHGPLGLAQGKRGN